MVEIDVAGKRQILPYENQAAKDRLAVEVIENSKYKYGGLKFSFLRPTTLYGFAIGRVECVIGNVTLSTDDSVETDLEPALKAVSEAMKGFGMTVKEAEKSMVEFYQTFKKQFDANFVTNKIHQVVRRRLEQDHILGDDGFTYTDDGMRVFTSGHHPAAIGLCDDMRGVQDSGMIAVDDVWSEAIHKIHMLLADFSLGVSDVQCRSDMGSVDITWSEDPTRIGERLNRRWASYYDPKVDL